MRENTLEMAECIHCGEETIPTGDVCGIELCSVCWHNNVASQYLDEDDNYTDGGVSETERAETEQSGIGEYA